MFPHLIWHDYRCRCSFLYLSLMDGCFLPWFLYLHWSSGLNDYGFLSFSMSSGPVGYYWVLFFLSFWGGLRFPRSSLISDKVQVFWSCSPGYGAKWSLCNLGSLELVWSLGSLGPAWPPTQLQGIGYLDLAWIPVKLKSAPEAVDLGFLDVTWALLKQKSSSKVIDQDTGWEVQTGLFGMFKRILWVVGGVLHGVHRTSLTYFKAAGAVGPCIEHREEGVVWCYWVGFKKY